MTPESIAHFLRRYGFPVLSVTEGTDQIDGEVKVTETIGVQVGSLESYAAVYQIDLEKGLMTSCPARKSNEKTAILVDIRKLLNS